MLRDWLIEEPRGAGAFAITHSKTPDPDTDCGGPESGVLPVTPRGSGAEGARTPDLLGAIQALSQLSYSPVKTGPDNNPTLAILQATPPEAQVAGPGRPAP